MHPYHRHYKSHNTTRDQGTKQINTSHLPIFGHFPDEPGLARSSQSSSSIYPWTKPLAISGTGFFFWARCPSCHPTASKAQNGTQSSDPISCLASSFLHTPLDSIAPFIPARLDVSTKNINLEKVKKNRNSKRSRLEDTMERFNVIQTPSLIASFPTTTWVGWQQKGNTILHLMKQELLGWQCHQLDHIQIICTSLQIDSHASTSSLNVT